MEDPTSRRKNAGPPRFGGLRPDILITMGLLLGPLILAALALAFLELFFSLL
jgi:hypothetical protein